MSLRHPDLPLWQRWWTGRKMRPAGAAFGLTWEGQKGYEERMPQVQLPVFPNGSIEINPALACRTEGEQVIYYNGHLPVFMHAKEDLASFRLFTAQLIVQGSATQGDIHR